MWAAGLGGAPPTSDSGAAAVLEQLEKLPLIEHRHTELARLRELRARLAPGDEEARLLRDAPRHLGAARGERLLGLLTRHRRESPGDDEGAAGECLRRAGRDRHVRPGDTLLAQRADH